MKMLDSVFCYYLMISDYVVNGLNKYMKGENSPSINIGVIDEWLFPIPPLSEQRRICDKLQEVLPAVDKYGRLQCELESLDKEVFINLRKSVLQEAIQGKLVAQDPNDEPAAELLKRIRNEKARLVKEKKIKRDKNETVIYRKGDSYYEKTLATGEVNCIDDEIPFEIPKGWEWARLGYICSLVDGMKKEGHFICHDAKYLRGKSDGVFIEKGKFVKKGDNIILVDGENSGEVFTVPCDGYMGSTFKQLWVSSAVYLPFVLNFILFYKDLLRKSKRGSAIPHLNKNLFYTLIIGIPPLSEQRRICSKLQEVLPVMDYNAPENLGMLIR